MLLTIILIFLILLLSNTSTFKVLLLIGVGILFNPITMLIIIIIYESTKRGIK
jgi:hypothetical protein